MTGASTAATTFAPPPCAARSAARPARVITLTHPTKHPRPLSAVDVIRLTKSEQAEESVADETTRPATIHDVPRVRDIINGHAELGKMLFKSYAQIYEALRDFAVYEVETMTGRSEERRVGKE